MDEANPAIVAVARRLPAVASVRFQGRSGVGSRRDWNGCGDGEVRVERDADGSVLFDARLRFRPTGSGRATALPLRDLLRWRIGTDRIVLSHLRFGAEAETIVAELVPAAAGDARAKRGELRSSLPHRCGADLYHARLRPLADGFVLLWRILGPGKNERLRHHYRG